MRFWKKTFSFVILLITFIGLQCYAKSIGQVEATFLGNYFSFDLYILFAALTGLLFVIFISKTFLSLFLSLFSKKKEDIDSESAKSIANLILCSDFDFLKNIDNFNISEKHKILKTALILKRNLKYKKKLELTGIDFIDIRILKKQLFDLLETGNNLNAIDLTKKLIRSYAKHLNIVRDEILSVAILAKKNNIAFSFDPTKYKYDLPNSFVDKYLSALSLLDFELAGTDDLKLKILEKTHKNHKNNFEVAMTLLNFGLDKFNDKKIIEITKHSFTLSPNRIFANILLKLKRNDLFEIAQEIAAQVPDYNLEKLWLLSIIAISLDFIQKAKDLIYRISEIDNSDDLLVFYIMHQNKFSNDNDILTEIKRKIKGK